jgi:hypothetical protein
MKNNLGTVDRVIRLLISAVIIILYATNTIYGIWGIVLLIIAGLLLVTAVIGFCPGYEPLRINTAKKNKEEPPKQ